MNISIYILKKKKKLNARFKNKCYYLKRKTVFNQTALEDICYLS